MSKLHTKLIFGGSFDPIHLGHLQHIESLKQEFDPCEAILLPNALSPLKQKQFCLPEQRLRCLELAVAQSPNLQLDTRELKRQEPSYTLLSLQEFANESPHDSRIFVLGMDSLIHLDRWYKWRELFDYANLLVLNRPGYNRVLAPELRDFLAPRQVDSANALSQTEAGRIAFIQQQEIPISSSQIRDYLVSQPKHPDLKRWLPKSVYDYIQAEGIYQL
ncbi:nicotinate-nucleotide adenylyltransferase [Alginatibacterium sediminis]|uniref:Probable nicotinate-nucleotide adenylyltransferase n=1 Tax=Alginatibacterium sediminis TaxID=2164068 RepID=A0A420E5D9_9ALTE|nr:nicotinate-nucleotide adenylyltransferase [Alginatibacterium sediminis]RKF12757.1 nicotinate-nucleotide adenylyltransferase [Alginatibacterium sediminis]